VITGPAKTWIKEFGLEDRKPPHFFSDPAQLEDLTNNISQSQVLHRAFKQLDIDGILCIERNPVVYFRQMDKIDSDKIAKIHHSFWNQGIAPILAIITPDEVHIYSGLTPPRDFSKTASANGDQPGFVETLERVHDQLCAFLLSVETGEYFNTHKRSFDPQSRVDRKLLRNLKAVREELSTIESTRKQPQTLDALLCRLVFTCYLFDRGIIDRTYLQEIGINHDEHLRDILARKTAAAKKNLYTLFIKLGKDFNGDLFTDDLKAECELITTEHLAILDDFFQATDIKTGQLSFWTYDFSLIPIETISAIYEHFLKVSDEKQKKDAGAFYTPRFLAEFVIDLALENETSLLDKKFLDPACGSGIFLVGLFNRLAQEWKIKNSGARYDRRAQGLMNILQTNLFGVDYNPSACRITAFSLYLAFLDQLSPPDIQKLLGKWDRLPNLVYTPNKNSSKARTIYNIDFFTEPEILPEKVHYVIGNPPWGPVKNPALSKPEVWCKKKSLANPNREKAIPFIWKAPIHLEDGGHVSFILPHGILFNHKDPAIHFQESLFLTYTVNRVVNLADFNHFLFEESGAPAIIIQYSNGKNVVDSQPIDYWVPKTDWTVLKSDIIKILPQDRSKLKVGEILSDLKGDDGPQVWKKRFWATPRDWRLLERLTQLSRLRDIIGQSGKGVTKRWLIAEGFQPLGQSDNPANAKTIDLPSKFFINAKSENLNLFLSENDCVQFPSKQVVVRERSNKNVEIFKAPHVIVAQGFSHIAFADFDVSFRHALRGINGPIEDRELLIFLTAYLRSDLARYFIFHTSTNWGIYRQKVHLEELLRLPFPLPEKLTNPKESQKIVKEIARAVTSAMNDASQVFADREGIIDQTQHFINKLIYNYFDIDETEQILIKESSTIIIPSIQPSSGTIDIPSIKISNSNLLNSYSQLLCDRLNGWADQKYKIHCKILTNNSTGLGIAILEKAKCNEDPKQLPTIDHSLVTIISKLQKIIGKHNNTYELVRGLKIFDKNLLYITKPIGQRFWSQTAALNDADEIASTILMQSRERT
jgi:hypothetical protein